MKSDPVEFRQTAPCPSHVRIESRYQSYRRREGPNKISRSTFRGVAMVPKRLLSIGVAVTGVLLTLTAATDRRATTPVQSSGDDITGVVTGPKRPEARV